MGDMYLAMTREQIEASGAKWRLIDRKTWEESRRLNFRTIRVPIKKILETGVGKRKDGQIVLRF